MLHFITVSAVFLLVLSVRTDATSDPRADCDVIFNMMKQVRDNVANNPSLKEIYGDAIIDQYKTSFEETTGVSIKDDTALKQLACKMAEATNTQQLAKAVKLTEPQLEKLIGYPSEESLRKVVQQINEIQTENNNFHTWLQNSGFPDNLPVTTSYHETKKMLDAVPDVGHGEKATITFATLITFGETKKKFTNDQIAKMVTDENLTTLDEYLEKLEIDDNNAVYVRNLKMVRKLGERNGYSDFKKAVNAYRNVFYTMIDAHLVELWD